MKNKKGFTLVELLAVIAILAILVIIAMPNILKRFNETKKNIFVDEVKTIYNGATSTYLENSLNGSNKTILSSKNNDLDLDGEDMQYCIITNTKGEIEYMEVHNDSYIASYDKTKNIDEYNINDIEELKEGFTLNCDEIANKIKKKKEIRTYTTETPDITSFEDDYYVYEKASHYSSTSETTKYLGYGWSANLKPSLEDSIVSIDTAPYSIINNEKIMFTSFMFSGAKNLSYIDLSGFDTSGVKSMSSMFSQTGYNVADDFQIIGLEEFNTSNVSSMQDVFWQTAPNASNSFVIDVSNWDTTNVTTMYGMFSEAGKNATKWSIGDISDWDTSNVTIMHGMFSETGQKATKWSIGDISGWDTTNVKYMDYMFKSAGYYSDYQLDLSKWNVDNVENYEDFNKYVNTKVISPDFNKE